MNKPRTIDEQLNKSEHIQFPAPAAAFFRFYPSAAEGISGSGIKGPCRHGRGQADLIPLWLGNLCKLATIYIYVRAHGRSDDDGGSVDSDDILTPHC